MDQNTQPDTATPHSYIQQRPLATERRGGWHIVFALFVGLPAVLFWGVVIVVVLGVATLLGGEEEVSCNIARIPLHGIITTTDDGFTQLLGLGPLSSADAFNADVAAAADDDDIAALLIDIDSPGGTPVAADEMMSALQSVDKPVVAVVRDTGASAAYWVAAGADHIIASPVSNVGSIGVTMSYLETASSTDSEGARWVNLSSGAFKDAGHPERPLSDAEETHFRTQVASVHEYMVDRIAEAREPLSREEVATLADGRAYVGTEALRLKIVDALGGFDTAHTWLAERLGVLSSEVTLCEPIGGGWGDIF